jgi:hypothetical protein
MPKTFLDAVSQGRRALPAARQEERGNPDKIGSAVRHDALESTSVGFSHLTYRAVHRGGVQSSSSRNHRSGDQEG